MSYLSTLEKIYNKTPYRFYFYEHFTAYPRVLLMIVSSLLDNPLECISSEKLRPFIKMSDSHISFSVCVPTLAPAGYLSAQKLQKITYRSRTPLHTNSNYNWLFLMHHYLIETLFNCHFYLRNISIALWYNYLKI